jgi:hypothetical protein
MTYLSGKRSLRQVHLSQKRLVARICFKLPKERIALDVPAERVVEFVGLFQFSQRMVDITAKGVGAGKV